MPHLSHSCLFVGFALVSVAVALALVYCRPTGRVLLWMGAQDSDPYYLQNLPLDVSLDSPWRITRCKLARDSYCVQKSLSLRGWPASRSTPWRGALDASRGVDGCSRRDCPRRMLKWATARIRVRPRLRGVAGSSRAARGGVCHASVRRRRGSACSLGYVASQDLVVRRGVG